MYCSQVEHDPYRSPNEHSRTIGCTILCVTTSRNLHPSN